MRQAPHSDTVVVLGDVVNIKVVEKLQIHAQEGAHVNQKRIFVKRGAPRRQCHVNIAHRPQFRLWYFPFRALLCLCCARFLWQVDDRHSFEA